MKIREFYCVNKIKNDKGLIEKYELRDKSGNKKLVDKKGLIDIFNSEKIIVLNLKLDKLGRVIDKKCEEINWVKKEEKQQVNNIEDRFRYGFVLPYQREEFKVRKGICV